MKPKDTKRNRLIKKAVKKAVKDFRQTFIWLGNELSKKGVKK